MKSSASSASVSKRVHGVDHMQLGSPCVPAQDLALLRDDPDHLTAARERTIGDLAHESDAATAVHHTDATVREYLAHLVG